MIPPWIVQEYPEYVLAWFIKWAYLSMWERGRWNLEDVANMEDMRALTTAETCQLLDWLRDNGLSERPRSKELEVHLL